MCHFFSWHPSIKKNILKNAPKLYIIIWLSASPPPKKWLKRKLITFSPFCHILSSSKFQNHEHHNPKNVCLSPLFPFVLEKWLFLRIFYPMGYKHYVCLHTVAIWIVGTKIMTYSWYVWHTNDIYDILMTHMTYSWYICKKNLSWENFKIIILTISQWGSQRLTKLVFCLIWRWETSYLEWSTWWVNLDIIMGHPVILLLYRVSHSNTIVGLV